MESSPQAPENPPALAPPPRRRSWLGWTALGGVAALVAAFAIGESAGWPWLGGPAERWLSQRLQREIRFDDGRGTGLRIHLLGGLSLHAPRITLANPSWSSMGPMMVATDATLKLRYRDLLAFRNGQPLQVERLAADTLTVAVDRRADGNASWQFGPAAPAAAAAPASAASAAERSALDGIRFGTVLVRDGRAQVQDAVLKLSADSSFSVTERTQRSAGDPPNRIEARAQGRYDGYPLQASLQTGSALQALLPGAPASAAEGAVAAQLRVRAGRAHLSFDGHIHDVLGRRGLQGRFDVGGPSLAAVGEPLKLTLPTTRAFDMKGRVEREGTRWSAVVDKATVGRSQLNGQFVFDAPAGQRPRLTGRLGGPVLWLEDLGPAVGVATAETPAPARPGRVLPDRDFDLPSLRAMDADVAIKLERLESGSAIIQAVQPLNAHLVLQDGVLDIRDLDARLAQGSIRGLVQLDGREPVARWKAGLSAEGLQIERWILQPRKNQAQPYVTGRLGARVDIQGRGRSTAELLGSADGRAWLHWTQGTISHLAVEAAGLDIAQALGVLLRGDEPLPVTCGAADLSIKSGQVRPQVMLVDTRDSTIWIDGQLSLATEEMALVARVAPKDFSLIALRTPLHIDGSFGAPTVSLEKGPLIKRLVPAAALAVLFTPLAALIPLIDTGDDEAREAISGCKALAAKRGAR